MDYQGLPPVDVLLPATPDEAVPHLLDALGGAQARKPAAVAEGRAATSRPTASSASTTSRARCRTRSATATVTLTHLPLSWNGATWPFRHPLDYLGSRRRRRRRRRPGQSRSAPRSRSRARAGCRSAICGDGDFMMGNHRGLDRGALQDPAAHRRRATTARSSTTSCTRSASPASATGRSENRWIGQRISEPDIDLAALAARARRASASARSPKPAICVPTFEKAIAAVEAGKVAVVDVRVEPGYSAVATAAMLRGTEKA